MFSELFKFNHAKRKIDKIIQDTFWLSVQWQMLKVWKQLTVFYLDEIRNALYDFNGGEKNKQIKIIHKQLTTIVCAEG